MFYARFCSVENKTETIRNISAEQIQFIKKNGVNSIWSHICYLITSVDSCIWFYEIYENDERNSKLLKKFSGSNISYGLLGFLLIFFCFAHSALSPDSAPSSALNSWVTQYLSLMIFWQRLNLFKTRYKELSLNYHELNWFHRNNYLLMSHFKKLYLNSIWHIILTFIKAITL